MERPCPGQAESFLWGEPQRVWLGAHHHTARALKWHSSNFTSHDDESDEKNVMELSFQLEVSCLSASHVWIKRLWLHPPAKARPSGAFWVSALVLVYLVEGFQFRGQGWAWFKCSWAGREAWWSLRRTWHCNAKCSFDPVLTRGNVGLSKCLVEGSCTRMDLWKCRGWTECHQRNKEDASLEERVWDRLSGLNFQSTALRKFLE